MIDELKEEKTIIIEGKSNIERVVVGSQWY
jgi:hypothetical protein